MPALTAVPIYKQIEATLNDDGNVVLRLLTRGYVGSTPVDLLTVVPTLAPPEEWDGTAWVTDVADAVENTYIDSGYTYPS